MSKKVMFFNRLLGKLRNRAIRLPLAAVRLSALIDQYMAISL